MRTRVLVPAALALLLTACASAPPVPSPDSGLSADSKSAQRDRGSPFAGLWLENAQEGGAWVRGMVAGPAAVAGVFSEDRIVRIDGIEVDARLAHAMINASSPGSRLSLDLVREDSPLRVELVIESIDRWSGPAAYAAAVPYSVTPLNDYRIADPVIEQVLAEVPEAMPVNERLDRMFAEMARDDTGYHKLPLIRAALMQPGSMMGWRENVLIQMRASALGHTPIVEVMCETLALACPERAAIVPHEPASVAAFSSEIAAANRNVRKAFQGIEGGRAQAIEDMHYLLEKTAADRTLLRQPNVLRGIRAMQVSMRVDLATLLAAADNILANAHRLPVPLQTGREPPVDLVAAVQGEIIDFIEVDHGYVVFGGPGPNRYDMDNLYAVIDFGGDDTYRWRDDVALETQTVVDLEGNDRYLASRGGPAAGWLGVSVLIDSAGDDHYESPLGGCGAGVLGFGLLFDDDGTDTYQCAAWSLGAGLYGSGIVVDRGDDSDVYLSQVFSQGVGGPRGLGLLFDSGGGDLYRANGPVASAYGTPASYMAFSQGVGVGIRPYDFGGVGMLLDLGGDDRYEGGEFSQGGGYFWGVGLLHDEAGNDLYYGNRYAQGFAAHQAFGMLVDMRGDDVYWSMSAAGQGAAWDQSIAILFEGDGDDVYRAAALSQGMAAQQSRASLDDIAGDDTYWSSSDVAQGVAGGNSYHFRDDDPIYSIGVMLDEAGADVYSTGLHNGELRQRLIFDGAVTGSGIAGFAMDID